MKILPSSLMGKVLVVLYISVVAYGFFFLNVYWISQPSGVSMQPQFIEGDYIIMQRRLIDFSKLKNGTIIVFQVPEWKEHKGPYLICHRIINVFYDKQGVFYLTKGDNNAWDDRNSVRPKDIVGVVIWRLRLSLLN